MNLYPNNIRTNRPSGSTSLGQLLDSIQHPTPNDAELYEQIYEAELLHLWAWKAELKSKLYYTLPCAICKGARSYDNIIEFTGLLAFDFDHIEDAPGLRDYLFEQHPQIVATWLSASKKGVKALARIPIVTSVEEFKAYYWGMATIMNRYVGFDTATQNAVLPMFLSYDKDMKRRTNAQVWTMKGTNPKITTTPRTQVPRKVDYSAFEVMDILDQLRKAIRHIDTNGHPQVRAAAYAAGGYVGGGYITIEKAEELMTSLIEENDYLSKGTAGYIKTAKEMIQKGIERPLFL